MNPRITGSLALVVILALAACGNSNNDAKNATANNTNGNNTNGNNTTGNNTTGNNTTGNNTTGNNTTGNNTTGGNNLAGITVCTPAADAECVSMSRDGGPDVDQPILNVTPTGENMQIRTNLDMVGLTLLFPFTVGQHACAMDDFFTKVSVADANDGATYEAGVAGGSCTFEIIESGDRIKGKFVATTVSALGGGTPPMVTGSFDIATP